MAKFQFLMSDIMNITNATVSKFSAVGSFAGVSTDTRDLVEGMLFVALRGEKFDGHNFLEEAAHKGAMGAIVDKRCDKSKYAHLDMGIFVVEDTLKAYQQLAHAWREKLDIPVVAITGSNGKTTTKDLTAAVLSGKYKVHKTMGNFNNEIGLPKTLLSLTAQDEVAVVEMGMRGLGQIAELAAIAHPNIGVITNVGEAHMELLGSIANIATAKAELIDAIEIDGYAILNADDELVINMANHTKGKVLYYGIQHAADIKAFDIQFTPEGTTRFQAIVGESSGEFHCKTLGMHNVYNCLAAIAVGYAMNLTVDEIQAGLDQLEATPMRFSMHELKSWKIINDTYNASPSSTRASLENLKHLPGNRKWLVMGDMFELGNMAIEAHQSVADMACQNNIYGLITMGSLTKHTAARAGELNIPISYHAQSHEDAYEFLNKHLEPHDIVLVKGSHGMHMDKIIELLENEY